MRLFLQLAVLVCFAVAVRADVVEQGVRNSAPSGLSAGVARADITPPVGIPQMNWGAQTHVGAEGIDPAGMIATALVISDGSQKFAMVDIDSLFPNYVVDAIGRAAAATGIPPTHIRIGATHTHAGPFLTKEKGPVGYDLTKFEKGFDAYWSVVTDKIAGAIVEANRKLEPVHVGGARGAGTININRRMRPLNGAPPAVGRNPEGLVDRDLTVVRIDRADGSTLAVLVNFQCHGTVMAWENKMISPDWPGMMRKEVEHALPGSKCLFFQGAAGNQGPIEGFTGDLGVAHRLGRILGHQAAALALQTDTVKRSPKFEGFVESTAFIARQPWRVTGPRDGTLKFAEKVLEVPGREYTPAEVDKMRSRVRDAEAKAVQIKSQGDAWATHAAEARVRRFQDLLDKWQKAKGDPIKVRVQLLRIGEVVIASMPGEPFAEIGQAVKKASPFPITLFCGYSSGEGGEYMPIEGEYAFEGYEVDRTPYARQAADQVVAGMISLFGAIR
ncbi:MAG: neutral/alkaline non-lysosomal ceramidase N-terminal domain-containing protein [Bryobacterales bacterium]|nr:neutral/alkaline non-lysosomal ceramidase N-terminal domain-containing protein [Bryobacterales bacterium]